MARIVFGLCRRVKSRYLHRSLQHRIDANDRSVHPAVSKFQLLWGQAKQWAGFVDHVSKRKRCRKIDHAIELQPQLHTTRSHSVWQENQSWIF
jgi:hypothetical protein